MKNTQKKSTRDSSSCRSGTKRSDTERSKRKPHNPRLHIILDNIRSAFNVGSIFRTADATGCAMIHTCGYTPHPPNPKLEKTALGALETVPWKHHRTTLDAIEHLKSKGIPVISVEIAEGSANYSSIDYPSPVALVFGHEVKGVCQLVLDQSDKVIHIPMNGAKESLNVATAAGIIMFEAIR